jgi:hypothetical protein
MVVYTCILGTQEAKVGGSWVWGQHGLQSKFEATLKYTAKPCLKYTEREKSSLLFLPTKLKEELYLSTLSLSNVFACNSEGVQKIECHCNIVIFITILFYLCEQNFVKICIYKNEKWGVTNAETFVILSLSFRH